MSTLAIDLGGTNLRAGLLADGADEPTALGRWNAPATLEAFRDRVQNLLDEHGATRLGVAIPGLARGTVAAWVPNLPFLDGADLARVFSDRIVAVANDAQFSLLAEAHSGAANGAANAILLAIGTGIGSAVLADGRILRGEAGSATSFGWACADPADLGHDAHGWLERHASGTALDRLAEGLGHSDGSSLVAAARDGDRGALSAIERPMTVLGVSLAGAVALTGSRLVIFAGGVADSLDVLGPPIERALVRQLPPHLRDVRLTKAGYGTRAALVGAGLAARGHATWGELVR